MPLQILQKGPSAMQGALLGLGQGLQELAANKLAAMRQANEQAQFAKTLQSTGQYSPEIANLVASLPINDRLKALQSLPTSPGQTGSIQQTAVQPVIPEAVVQEPTIHAAAQQQQFKELAGQKPELPSSFDMAQELRRNALGFPETFTPESVKELIKQFEGFGHQIPPQQRKQIEQQAAEISKSPAQMAALQQRYENAVKNNEMMELRRPGFTGQAVPLEQLQQPGQPLFRKPLTEMEKIAKERLEIARKKEERAERGEAFKLTKEERKEINDKAKAAKLAVKDLDRLEELEKEGKLDTPGYLEFLKNSGFDIPALMQEGTQEYNKIVNNFTREAKSVYGARISNLELEQFMKTLPSLSLSPAGRKRVIANLRYIKDADLAYSEALKETIRENNGIPPLDLTEKIDDKIEKKLDSLAKRFKTNLSKPVPEGQNKLATAMQSVLGSAVGALPGFLGGVAKSAAKGIGTGVGLGL